MLKQQISKHIEEVASRQAQEHHDYHNNLELVYQRNLRRIENPEKKEVKTPEHWHEDKKHNPFYVLKHKESITKSIFKKLIDGSYEPFKPYLKQVPKKNSSKTRPVYIFQLPDEAVSNYLYQSLIGKNKHRFSSFSYAYRNDRNVHFAIQDIALDIKESPRMFIAEFDFQDFFGSIEHHYLLKQLDNNGFLVSEFEKDLIYKFLKPLGKGIPQGTSISLFLANLVCWELDKKLEKEGLRFARYADDTIIWSEDYAKICKSFNIINEFSKQAGVRINFQKSEGISLLSKRGMPSEFDRNKSYIDFLGYSLSGDNVSIKKSSVNKIKKQISYLLYRNLIQPLNVPALKAVIIPSNDNDANFVTAIMQIRRYLYGNLNERALKNYLNRSHKRLNFKGIMSFYPLVDDEEQMKYLDRWLVSTILNALKKRNKLLLSHGHNRSNQFPFNMDAGELINECKIRVIKEKKGLIEIPSFLRISKAIRQQVITRGIEETMHPRSNEYNY
ncbi:reverse transcriptase domain-containing protein [Bacillus sp. XB1]